MELPEVRGGAVGLDREGSLGDLIAADGRAEVFDLGAQIESQVLAALLGEQLRFQAHNSSRRIVAEERLPVGEIQTNDGQIQGGIADGICRAAPGQAHRVGEFGAKERISAFCARQAELAKQAGSSL